MTGPVIAAVVFDIGNVVCAFEPESRLATLAQLTRIEPEQIYDAIWGSGLDARSEVGEVAFGDLEAAILDALDHRIDAATLRSAWSTAFPPSRAVCDVVGRVDRARFAFTNNGPMLTECLAHELREVAVLFQRVIYSWQVGIRKPDPAAFERLCVDIGRPPETLLFVDDDAKNTASARAVGLDAVTFTGAGQLVVELTRRGVLGP